MDQKYEMLPLWKSWTYDILTANHMVGVEGGGGGFIGGISPLHPPFVCHTTHMMFACK